MIFELFWFVFLPIFIIFFLSNKISPPERIEKRPSDLHSNIASTARETKIEVEPTEIRI